MTFEIFMLFALMGICFMMRIPISFSLMLPSIFYFILTGQSLSQFAAIITGSMFSNYVILAAPLFIFAAYVMNSGQVTAQIFKFANGLLGRFKGGTALVNVFASLIFSGMTGSAIADAAGLGIMEIEQMKKEGYDDGFTCAITAASATIGPIFPPSLPFIVYSMLSGASVGALFLGGIIPGVLLAGSLMVYVVFVSHKKHLPMGENYPAKQFLKYTIRAVPALFTPVILLWGIYGGMVTPTEAGALAALYTIIISILIYRSLNIKILWEIFKKTASTTAVLGLMIAGSMIFSYIIALERFPNAVAELILGLTANKYIFLLVVNVIFIILGAFMDTATIQLVFIPIILPLVKHFGINLVHFGVVINLNIMIGLSTPPFGLLLFITSGIAETQLKDTIREILPIIVVMIVVLFLITFIPDLVLFIPNLSAK